MVPPLLYKRKVTLFFPIFGPAAVRQQHFSPFLYLKSAVLSVNLQQI